MLRLKFQKTPRTISKMTMTEKNEDEDEKNEDENEKKSIKPSSVGGRVGPCNNLQDA